MKKLYKLLIAIVLIAYFIYLVVSRVPAAYGVAALHSAMPNLWLTGVSGTIWSGTAQASQVDIEEFSIPLGLVEWELNAFSLVYLRPCLTFTASQPSQAISGNLCQQLGGNSYVRDVNVDGSMALINPLLPVEVQGRGSLQVVRGVFDKADVKKLEAQLSWQNARFLAIDNWIALGSYAAKLTENGEGGINAEVFDLQGPIKLNGNAGWHIASGWTVDATVTPQAGTPQQIVEGLQLIGEEVSAGTYQLIWP